MLEVFLFVFFAVDTLYICVLAIAGRFYSRKRVPVAPSFQRIAVLVPCYREDEVIISTVQHLFTLNYPESHYDVVVIADSMQPHALEALENLGCTVLPVQFKESLKSRSLNHALQQLPADRYAIAVIIDADNMLSRNFLMDVNNLFHAPADGGQFQLLQPGRVSQLLPLAHQQHHRPLCALCLIHRSLFLPAHVVIRWWTITALYLLALAVALPRIFYSVKTAKSFLILP